MGKPDEALPLLESSLDAIRLLEGSGSTATRDALLRLVHLYEVRGDVAGAARIAANELRLLADSANKAPGPLNDFAWWIVRAPGLTPETYELALRASRTAVERQPDTDSFVNTLGVALYRTGHFTEAIDTLRRSDELYTKAGKPQPANWAFLAMAHHRLNQPDEAPRCLGRAREIVAAQGVPSAETTAFLAEAEALLRPE